MKDSTAALLVLAGGVALGGIAVLGIKLASEPTTRTPVPSGKAARRFRRTQRAQIRARLERA